MRLNDGSTDGKAQAHSTGFGSEEGIKDTIAVSGIDPSPGILHDDCYTRWVIEGGCDPKAPFPSSY